MAISNPTVNVTPDIGGTGSVSGISNTGHTSTLSEVSAADGGPGSGENNTDTKTARWHTFQSVPGGLISLKLKAEYVLSGSVSASVDSAGTSSADIQFLVEYTIDNGSNWLTILNKTRSVSASPSNPDDSDSISENTFFEIILNPSQDVSLVQVRDKIQSNAQASAPTFGLANSNAAVTATISNIRLEAENSPASGTGQKPIMMM